MANRLTQYSSDIEVGRKLVNSMMDNGFATKGTDEERETEAKEFADMVEAERKRQKKNKTLDETDDEYDDRPTFGFWRVHGNSMNLYRYCGWTYEETCIYVERCGYDPNFMGTQWIKPSSILESLPHDTTNISMNIYYSFLIGCNKLSPNPKLLYLAPTKDSLVKKIEDLLGHPLPSHVTDDNDARFCVSELEEENYVYKLDHNDWTKLYETGRDRNYVKCPCANWLVIVGDTTDAYTSILSNLGKTIM